MNALLLVDLQSDFLPGGSLPVPNGAQVIPIINQLQPCFDLVVATQDWHPANHGSFAANHPGRHPFESIKLDGLPQTLWPIHCVQGSPGAEFAPAVNQENWARIFPKGTDPAVDSYSGFFDNGHRKATGLGDYLRGKNVSDLYVVGLATDYCVKFTVLDALELGFNTHLIVDACRGVDLVPGDVTKAIATMESAGAHILTSSDIMNRTRHNS